MGHEVKYYAPGVGAVIAFIIFLTTTLAGMIIGGSTKIADMGVLGGGIVGFIVGFIFLAVIGKKLVSEKPIN